MKALYEKLLHHSLHLIRTGSFLRLGIRKNIELLCPQPSRAAHDLIRMHAVRVLEDVHECGALSRKAIAPNLCNSHSIRLAWLDGCDSECLRHSGCLRIERHTDQETE